MDMSKALKQQFIDELNPLLIATEKAIIAGDIANSTRLSLKMLKLSEKYADKLDPVDFQEVLNNPIATAIAKRLGVQPR
jgi:hypothetical protein